jgi:Holliday junction resolvase
VRELLEADGWWVSRAAGSLGDADLVALRDGFTPRLIEVKSTATKFSGFGPAERRELLGAAGIAGALPLVAWWPKNGPLLWVPPSQWPSTSTTQEVS